MSFENDQYSVGLLWKNGQPSLITQILALAYTQRKFKQVPSTTAIHKQLINAYIRKGDVKKLTEKEFKTLTSTTNYIPHHGVTNVNKPGGLYRMQRRSLITRH